MKNKVYFVWQGIAGRHGSWKDGLYRAMKYLEDDFDIIYCEPTDEIKDDGIVLYWEAPCTINGRDGDKYLRVCNLPNKKILLFAGGPIQYNWIKFFDLVCVESEINKEELDKLDFPNMTAFGVNDDIMKPLVSEIIYDGIHHGTCASWKRQWLVGEALGEKGLVVGRYQDNDSYPFNRCKEVGCNVMEEQTAEQIAKLINKSWCCLQTSDYWGGGQRCTLEAMACGVPVICMSDSPKNKEYVLDSGFGLICDPTIEDIKKSVDEIKEIQFEPQVGVNYVRRKWSARNYYKQLKEAICYIQ